MGPRRRLTVVGLGPAGPDFVTRAAQDAVAGAARRFVRTRWHPASAAVEDAESFDALYETGATFEEVYRSIVETLIVGAQDAVAGARVVYCVPGSPFIAERSVELLRADARVDVDVIPGMSFVDLAWARLGIDPFEESVRLVDAQSFSHDAAGDRGPFLVTQCWSRELLSSIKLAGDPEEGSGEPVTVLRHLGCDDESVVEVDWDELDRCIEPDHMTTLYVRHGAAPVGRELAQLDELIHTLRVACPWDRKQTHASLATHLLEECYETLDAIAQLPPPESVLDAGTRAAEIGTPAYEHLAEELGDLLVQVLFHATLAAETGAFDLADVARITHDKLVGRHPHVFGDVVADTPDAVMANWEQIKMSEKGRASIMDGIPAALPALARAAKVQKKAASVGFDWDSALGPMAKITEEISELLSALEASGGRSGPGPGPAQPVAAELGDVLFSVVNLARHIGVDAEEALRAAAGRFSSRFCHMEVAAAEAGTALGELDADALDGLWEAAKASEL